MGDIVSELSLALRDPVLPALVVGAYLLGSIPFGYLIARKVLGKDIRTEGSGNIGATNVARVVGKKLGLLTLALDALKGAVPALAVPVLGLGEPAAQPTLATLAGAMALIGHCFPVWLGFRGGKGVATALGFLAAAHPALAAVGAAVFFVVFALTRTVSLGSIVASAALPIAYLAFRGGVPDGSGVPLLVALVVVLVKHRGNMRRLLRREEGKL